MSTSKSLLDDNILASILSDFEDDSDDDDEGEAEQANSERKRNRKDFKRSTKKAKPQNPWTTNPWLQLIRHPKVSDPKEPKGKEFRRKFRVPFPTFQKIVDKCKATGEHAFNYADANVAGEKSIPLELKILAVLRMLADGSRFLAGSEMANYISESALNSFFKLFNSLFRKHFQAEYIKVPAGEHLLRIMKTYIRLGLPGCIGSIDATFIPWDRCPSHLRNLCDGDKGVGLLFNVIVSHEKEVLSVSNGFYSTINDKISVKYDDFIQLLKENKIGVSHNSVVSYKVLIPTADGGFDEVDLSSFYVIADGGYIDIPQIIRGFAYSGEEVKYKFSDWIASVRKDVECLFGILKVRFRFLKNPITLQVKEDLDNLFVTCCIINNMILKEDGLDTLWESGVNWTTLNPAGEEAPEDVEADPVYRPVVHDPATFVPKRIADLIPQREIDRCHPQRQQFERLQLMLANHLQLMYRRGRLRWPKMRSEIEARFNTLPRAHFPDTGDLNLNEDFMQI